MFLGSTAGTNYNSADTLTISLPMATSRCSPIYHGSGPVVRSRSASLRMMASKLFEGLPARNISRVDQLSHRRIVQCLQRLGRPSRPAADPTA
jgi:hypothetical protein